MFWRICAYFKKYLKEDGKAKYFKYAMIEFFCNLLEIVFRLVSGNFKKINLYTQIKLDKIMYRYVCITYLWNVSKCIL